MCPNSKLTGSQLGHADLASLQATFHQIAPYAELTMLYFMGETTLHPSFRELMYSARATLKGSIALSSNAFAWNEEIMKTILDTVDVLVVPIDRWEKSAYETIRRGSKFDVVVEHAERLLQLRGGTSRPKVVVKGLDIHLPREGHSHDVDGEASRFRDYWLTRGAVPLAGWLNTWAGQMPNLLRLSSVPAPYSATRRTPCADLWFKMVINWQGKVVLCCHNWDYSIEISRLNGRTLSDAWSSMRITAARAGHARGDYFVESICGSCREWGEPQELESYLRLNDDDLFRVF